MVPAPGAAHLVIGRRKRPARGVRWTQAQYEEFLRKKGGSPPKGKTLVEVLTGTKPRRPKPVKGKTKTEADFEARLKYDHPSLTVLYEPLKLKIDRTCSYTPDFFIPELLTFYEIKGPHIFEDSVIKFKAARVLHCWAKFEMWQKNRLGNWRQIRELPLELID